jgi:hypothetical protein
MANSFGMPVAALGQRLGSLVVRLLLLLESIFDRPVGWLWMLAFAQVREVRA